jgi:hypothetical protein
MGLVYVQSVEMIHINLTSSYDHGNSALVHGSISDSTEIMRINLIL